MKKSRVVIVGIVMLAVVIGLLWRNKARMQAEGKTEAFAPFPVSVEKVNRRNIEQVLSFVGTIAANNDVAVVSETQGRVVAVNAQVGDYKRAGEFLVRVDDELRKAEFMKAEVSYERAKKDADRFSALRDEHAVTDLQKETAWQGFKIAEAEYIRARKAYRDTKISSPISGIITARLVDVGAMVAPGTVIANVVDISRLKVKLTVPELDAFKLKVGDAVEVTTDVYPEIAFAGKVATVGAKGDAAHNYPVEVSLPNSKEHPLRAGMFGRVHIKTASAKQALVVSKEAILNPDTRPIIFMADNGVARERQIVLGARSENYVQVLKGMREGESVVTFGQGKLKDGSAIQYQR